MHLSAQAQLEGNVHYVIYITQAWVNIHAKDGQRIVTIMGHYMHGHAYTHMYAYAKDCDADADKHKKKPAYIPIRTHTYMCAQGKTILETKA